MTDDGKEIVFEDGVTLGDINRLAAQAEALGYELEVDEWGWCSLYDAAGNWINCQFGEPVVAAEPQAERLASCTFAEVETWLAEKAQHVGLLALVNDGRKEAERGP